MVEPALYWMMLTTCKGATLNIVFLAGDSEDFEGWRQLTEKYEPKMRTRLAGQLMSILSLSPQDDRTNHCLGTRQGHLRTGQWQGLGR